MVNLQKNGMENTLKSFTNLTSGKLKLWKVMFFAIHGAVGSSWCFKVGEKVGVWSPKKIDSVRFDSVDQQMYHKVQYECNERCLLKRWKEQGVQQRYRVSSPRPGMVKEERIMSRQKFSNDKKLNRRDQFDSEFLRNCLILHAGGLDLVN
jgi:hypothetical protein